MADDLFVFVKQGNANETFKAGIFFAGEPDGNVARNKCRVALIGQLAWIVL